MKTNKALKKSDWTSYDPKAFVTGDIICNADKQDGIKLIVYTDDVAIWCVGLVHCAMTENFDKHPLFPLYFNELEHFEPLMRLGNLKDYTKFIEDIQSEVKDNISTINNYGK